MEDSFQTLMKWLDVAREKGWYKPHTIRQVKTALRRTAEAGSGRSFGSLEEFRNALPDIYMQWQQSRSGSVATARSYESRVRSLVTEYLTWQERPSTYMPPRRRSAARKARAAHAKAEKKAARAEKAAQGKAEKTEKAAPKAARKKAAAAGGRPRGRRGPRAAAPPAYGVRAETNHRRITLDHLEADIRWSKGVTPSELAYVLAVLSECRPAAGEALMKAASKVCEDK